MRPVSILITAALAVVPAACADTGYYGDYPAYASAEDYPYYNGAYWAYNDGGWYTGPTWDGTYAYVEPGAVPDYVNRHREHHAWNRDVHRDHRSRTTVNEGFNNRIDPSTDRGQEAIGGTGQDQRG